MLYDIGLLMGEFHNINVSSHDNEDSWIVTILSDMMQSGKLVRKIYE